VDRAFDRHRYDYRKALVDFGRGLSSETNLEALLSAIVERLPRALLVARVAIFLVEDSGRLRLAASHGLPAEVGFASGHHGVDSLALGFLDFDHASDHSHIFLENAQAALHLPEDQQRTAALLDLNYYLPCRVAASTGQDGTAAPRTIAVIGLGRTIGGDFLSSEDVELLESLASYIGIALAERAALRKPARQDRRVRAPEGIQRKHCGIDQRGNSCDRPRRSHRELERADGGDVRAQPRRSSGAGTSYRFPVGIVDAIDSFRNEQGVHHLYKFRMTTRAGNSAPPTSPLPHCCRAILFLLAASFLWTTSPSECHWSRSSRRPTS